MPLPDERPRQSVANLIGRFENQTKRQSLSAPSPRSSSVVSNITGDSAKEAIKEKREWPPKPVAAAEKSTFSPSPPGQLPPASQPPASMTSTSTDAPAPASQAMDITTTQPVETISHTVEAPSQPEHASDEILTPVVETPKPVRKAVAPKPGNAPPAKLLSKTASKPTPKQSLTPSTIAQPLKPQHTGTSTTSVNSRRAAARVPTTPARSKTPSRPPASHSTPASVRPKTPSSGLFAPTAASLARARNAPPPVPTPIKKATLSSSAADRLSKPTAASLSKARTAVVASPPSARSPPTKTATKTQVKPTSLRGRKPAPSGSSTRAAAAATTTPSIAAALEAEDTPGDEVDEHGYKVVLSDHATDLHDETRSNNVEVPDEAISGQEVYPEESAKIEPTIEAPEHQTNGNHLPKGHDTEHDSSDANHTTSEPESHPVTKDSAVPVQEVGKTVGAGTDIEDIVNLLEPQSISKLHRDSSLNLPEEVHEIPDED